MRISPFLVVVLVLARGSGDYAVVLEHLLAQFDGVVVARTDVRYPPWTRNHATRYVIRGSDGQERIFTTDPSDGGTHGFPIGTRLRKQRWDLSYEENGQPVNDFPLAWYGLWLIVDFAVVAGCVILAIMIRIRDRTAHELAAAVERGKRLLESGDDTDDPASISPKSVR